MKRILLVLTMALAVVLTLSLPGAAAEAPAPRTQTATERVQLDMPLEDTIIYCVTHFVEADLSYFEISYDELSELFFRLDDEGKLPWYGYSYSCSYVEDTRQALTFAPINLSPEEYRRAEYEQRVAEIIHEVILEGMDDWQKALAIHDYLIVNSSYDESLTRYSSYDLLIDGTAVCEGYAEAYKDIMNRLGIPCLLVRSDTMGDSGHAWNLIKIGGSWYHVDCTWDDPSPNAEGFVSHDNFLLTDEEAKATLEPHFGWETDITCDDISFSQAFWKGNYNQVIFLDSERWLTRRDDDMGFSIFLSTDLSGEATELYYGSGVPVDIGYGRYYYENHGLSRYDGKIWFSTSTELFTADPEFTSSEAVCSYDTQQEGKVIFSSSVREDGIHLTLRDHEGSFEELHLPLDGPKPHRHSYSQVLQEATCLGAGYEHSVCSECGFTVQVQEHRPKGHSYEETVVKKSTLFSGGEVKRTCAHCGDSHSQVTEKLELGGVLSRFGLTYRTAGILLLAALALMCIIFRFILRALR